MTREEMDAETMKDYPEHAKLAKVREQSQAIHEFVEFLREDKKIHLCEFYPGAGTVLGRDYEKGAYLPTNERLTELVATFLGIDEKKLEEEKQKMLSELRRQNEKEDKTDTTRP